MDADANTTDGIRFVRNEVRKKLTFETLSETLNEQNYDPVLPQEKKNYKGNVGKDKVLTWTTDEPKVSRKRNDSNIICNKPGPSRRVKEYKNTTRWKVIISTNKNIEAFDKEHVGFDENDNITFTKPTDIHSAKTFTQ